MPDDATLAAPAPKIDATPHILGDADARWPAAVSEWRREWPAGLAAFIGGGLCISAWPSVSSLFVQPLQDEFGWTRGQIAFAYNASIVVAFVAPAFGQLIDRVGVRRILIVAMILTAMGYLALASMPNSLLLYYALYLFTALIGICTSGLSFTRVVTGAFIQSRGLALAVSRSGIGLSGAILPPAMFALISTHGWRAGFVLLAMLILLVALPVVWICTKSGAARPAQAIAPRGTAPARAWLAQLRDRKVLLLCLAAGFSFAPVVGLLQQLQPLLVGKGLEPGQAAAMIGLVGAAALAGTIVSGLLVDRIWAPLVGCVFTVAPALGCFLLLPARIDTGAAIPAVILLGLAQGAEIDIIAYMVARYFGLRSYASIYGLSIFAIAMLNALFSNIIAQIYDRFGDYRLAIMICSASFLAAACCYLAMGRYPALTDPEGRDDPPADRNNS